MLRISIMHSVLFALVPPVITAAPLGTAFTYQGQLRDGGVPANDDYDMRFSLFDVAAGGTAVAGSLVFDGAGANPPSSEVLDGLFTVGIDFGDVFHGTALWLQIEVQPHGTVGYTTLLPRQALTAAPFSIRAMNGVAPPSALNVEGTTGDVGVGTADPAEKLHVVGNTVVDGSDNTGSTAAFRIASGSQQLLADGNEIDSNGALYLNYNSDNDVILAGGGTSGSGRLLPKHLCISQLAGGGKVETTAPGGVPGIVFPSPALVRTVPAGNALA